MSFYNKFVGINQLPKEGRGIMRRYGLIRAAYSLVGNLTGTFFILFLIDKLGFTQSGVIIATVVLVQLITDYPSGAIGDFIGQRWVLTSAALLSAVGFYLLSFADSITSFYLLAIVFGVSTALQSGALQSWLDNNYKELDEDEDPDKKNYGFSMSRFGAIDALLIGLAILIGGWIATNISRVFAFQLQSGLFVILAVFVFILMIDIKKEDTGSDNRMNLVEYFGFLKGGIVFYFSRKTVFIYLTGNAVINVFWAIWGSLILFPLYFGYTGSDEGAGLLRSAIFFTGVALSILLGKYTMRISTDKIHIAGFAHSLLLLPFVMALIYFFPVTNSFSSLGSVLLYLIMIVGGTIPPVFLSALMRRVTIDLVPSENRNAIYSLVPTISGALSIPMIPFTGVLIEKYGLIYGVGVVFIISLIGFSMFYVYTILRKMELLAEKSTENHS